MVTRLGFFIGNASPLIRSGVPGGTFTGQYTKCNAGIKQHRAVSQAAGDRAMHRGRTRSLSGATMTYRDFAPKIAAMEPVLALKSGLWKGVVLMVRQPRAGKENDFGREIAAIQAEMRGVVVLRR